MPGARRARTAETQRSQTCLIGYSIVWLPDPVDARNVYYVQALSSVSLVVIGYLYGGFLSEKTVTAYHALLIVYLTMGNVVSGMFTSSNVQMHCTLTQSYHSLPLSCRCFLHGHILRIDAGISRVHRVGRGFRSGTHSHDGGVYSQGG